MNFTIIRFDFFLLSRVTIYDIQGSRALDRFFFIPHTILLPYHMHRKLIFFFLRIRTIDIIKKSVSGRGRKEKCTTRAGKILNYAPLPPPLLTFDNPFRPLRCSFRTDFLVRAAPSRLRAVCIGPWHTCAISVDRVCVCVKISFVCESNN